MTVVLLGLVVVAAIIVSLTAYSAADDRVKDAERRNEDLRNALEQIKTTVWDQRELSPELSDQVMAAIARAERRNSERA